jgi:transposase
VAENKGKKFVKAKPGRPLKLNQEIQDKICDAIRAGNYIETASAYAGVSKDSLYRWLKRGAREKQRLEKDSKAKVDKKEALFVRFSDAIEKALADAEVRDVALIGKAAEDQWQAAAWRLERKFPNRWGRRVALEHSGKEGSPINIKQEVDLKQLSLEELKQLETLLEKANPSDK